MGISLQRDTMALHQYAKQSRPLVLSLIVITVMIAMVLCNPVSASSSGSTTGLFEPPLDPDHLPASAGGVYTSSSSFASSETSGTPSSSGEKNVIITESRCNLTKDQPSTQMILFENPGTLTVTSLSGTGVEVFSQNGGDWPESKPFRADYGKSDMVTGSSPLTLDITPGSWYFTIFPLGDSATYDLIARQDGGSSTGSKTTSVPSASVSSSMGVASFSMG